MKATIVFFPNLTKKSNRHGKIPLYARVIINRTKAENRLVAEIPETDLLKWDAITMRFTERSHLANLVLNGLDQKFTRFVLMNSERLKQFKARDVLDEVLGEKQVKKTGIMEYCDQYYNTVVVNNSNLSNGTKKNYRKALNHLRSFLQYRKSEGLDLSQLSNPLALEFKDYLLGNSPGKLTRGMTEPSAAGNIKKFRTIFDRAIIEGKIEKNPFKSIKLNLKSPRRARLSISDVQRLTRLDLSKFEAQRVYLDIFLFSIFTGIAYQDAMSLTKSNLTYFDSGEMKITICRAKSKVQTELFLVKQAKEIISKYSGTPEQQIRGSLLPHRSNKAINLQLKFLAELANIPLALTHHIARHTYRQLLAESCIEDRAVIKSMMGHTKNNDIDDIYYIVTEKKLLGAKNLYETFLTQNL